MTTQYTDEQLEEIMRIAQELFRAYPFTPIWQQLKRNPTPRDRDVMEFGIGVAVHSYMAHHGDRDAANAQIRDQTPHEMLPEEDHRAYNVGLTIGMDIAAEVQERFEAGQ